MSKRSRLKGKIEGLEALIEVSGVDIANQIKAVKALGKESVDLYKQFNQNFGNIMVGKLKSKVPKGSGSLASSIRSAKLKMELFSELERPRSIHMQDWLSLVDITPTQQL